MRRPILALLIVLVALLGTVAPVAAAQTSTAKVAIIVGADTPQYIDAANELYADAISHTPNVVRVYTPYATWKAVKAATKGANVVIYMGHGNGWPSPYTYDPAYRTKDGFGLNAVAGAGGKNLTYYGEPWIRGDYDEGLQMASDALVFLHHLCYASGNSEPGQPEPSQSVARQRVDNYGSAFLAAGASAVIADGRSHAYYLHALFTKTETLLAMWRGAPNYNGNEIAFTATRSTGQGIMDPDTGGASPAGYYRSIVGDLGVMTNKVIGMKLPPGVRGDPGVTIAPAKVSTMAAGEVVRTSGGATTSRGGSTTPTRTR